METERPPVDLVSDIEELLDLLGAVVDPIAERVQPQAEEDLGLIFAWVAPIELRFRAWISNQVKALPGNAPSKPR